MNSSQHELPQGTYLQGKYRIDKVLGQGGFGITYLATQVNLDARVCIKELYLSGMCTRGSNYTVQSQNLRDLGFEDFKTRFINEARELARFNHPNIVRVTDVFEENNTAYYVMDYVEGETLKQWVSNRGPMAPASAKPYIAQLLDAVQAVHDRGMLHRDLKPDNILITPQGKVVLIDFGSARAFGEGHTMTQTAILTPGYAPLEQYSEKARRGPFTDIYSLGGTLYFLFTGQKPIPATDRSFEALPSPDTLNSAVSKPLASVLLLAMNLKPEDRFQTVSELRQALLGGGGSHASSGDATRTVAVETPRASKPAAAAAKAPTEQEKKRKRNAFIAIAVVVGLIAILAIGVAVEQNSRRISPSPSLTAMSDTAAIAPRFDSAYAGVVSADTPVAVGNDVKEAPEGRNDNLDPVVDPGVGGGSGSGDDSRSYTIRMQNKCNKNVDFCFVYYDPVNECWLSKGWYLIKAGATWEYTISSSIGRIFWYAENRSADLNWGGSDGNFCIKRPDKFDIYYADEGDCGLTVGFHKLELNTGSTTFHSMSCD